MSRRVELVLDIDHVYGLRDSLREISPYDPIGQWVMGKAWSSPLIAAIKECIEAEEEALGPDPDALTPSEEGRNDS